MIDPANMAINQTLLTLLESALSGGRDSFNPEVLGSSPRGVTVYIASDSNENAQPPSPARTLPRTGLVVSVCSRSGTCPEVVIRIPHEQHAKNTYGSVLCRPSIACGNEEDHKGLPDAALRGECKVFRRTRYHSIRDDVCLARFLWRGKLLVATHS
jgi:hypothetical protein